MSKQDELQYEQQEKRIQAQSDAFITLLTKRGILGDSQIDDAQKRAARQEKTKNCYHNTLMLLQHYRTLVWMLECFPETVAAELDRPFEGGCRGGAGQQEDRKPDAGHAEIPPVDGSAQRGTDRAPKKAGQRRTAV